MALQDTDILAAQRGTTAYQVPASEIKTYAGTVQATETVAGKVELATAAETTAGTDNTRAVHPAGLAAAIAAIPAQVPASETVAGIVELADATETTAGTDNTRAVHPAGLTAELSRKIQATATAPANPKDGDLWYDLNGGRTYMWVNDGNSSQWVDTSPPLAAPPIAGYRNIVINGLVNTPHEINQRGLTHAGVADGAYFADRWKRVDGSTMTQIIEDGSYEPGAGYVLSGVGVTTQLITAPTSGHWTLPAIPSTASYIQLERGETPTVFERRPVGAELALCQRYLIRWGASRRIAVVARGVVNSSYRAATTLPVALRGSGTLTWNDVNITQATTSTAVTSFNNFIAEGHILSFDPLVPTTGLDAGFVGTAAAGFFQIDAEL